MIVVCLNVLYFFKPGEEAPLGEGTSLMDMRILFLLERNNLGLI